MSTSPPLQLKTDKGPTSTPHGATTSEHGLRTTDWNALIASIKEVTVPAALTTPGALRDYIVKIGVKVEAGKISNSVPATLMAIVKVLEHNGDYENGVGTVADQQHCARAAEVAADLLKIDTKTWTWSDSEGATKMRREKVHRYTVAKLATCIHKTMHRGHSESTRTSRDTRGLTSALKWNHQMRPQEALGRLQQQAERYVKDNGDHKRMNNIRTGAWVASQFADALWVQVEDALHESRTNEWEYETWEPRRARLQQIMESPYDSRGKSVRTVLGWIDAMVRASLPFVVAFPHAFPSGGGGAPTTSRTDRQQGRSRRIRDVNHISGVSLSGEAEDESPDDQGQIALSYAHQSIHAIDLPMSCSLCGGKKHTETSCFQSLSTDPGHRIPLIYRGIRASRQLSEEGCNFGLTREMIMTNAYHDSKVTETHKLGRTFTWGAEHKHSMDTVINAGTHQLSNIPKCSNPNCVIQTKADWKFTEARDFTRSHHCEFVVNINHILMSRQIVDFATQLKGPLRGVPDREVNHF
jgi:hypothetical protein